MLKRKGLPVGVAVISAMLLAAPQPGEAAWWKFGRDKQAAEQSDDGVVQAQATPSDRMNRLENSLRSLTGQIEELTFQVRQLQEQLKRAQEDNEFRFRDLEGGGQPRKQAATPPADGSSVAEAAPQVAPAQEQPIERLSDGAGTAEATGGQTLGDPPRSLGTLSVDEPTGLPSDQPLDLSAAAQGTAPVRQQKVALAPSGDPRQDYEVAYSSIQSGDYGQAEAGFRQFLATYPGDRLAPDAQYWLGESYFARGQYREAADEFIAGYKAYPKSEKGPDTLLKLGLSLAGLGERDMACSTYTKVLKQYPQVSNAMRQRIKVEQASARC
jgi:tol-pal system protein YbgF